MNKNFWKNIPKPIIGLAPMDGYSDSAFRRICKTVNPNIITVTEFTSADGLHHNRKILKQKLQFHPSEQPVIAQIFGKNEETFITAAKVCEEMGFSGIDINMGCPSKKVVKSEHGVALRKKPDLAAKLVEALATNTHLPISVKTRLGWSNADNLIPFCKRLESAGANMICIHARTYKEPYNVPAQWEHLYELKEHLNIPLLGNGGVTSYSDGINKLNNLDGFLIGQATFGNPWIFDPLERKLSMTEKYDLIIKHAEWLIEHKGEQVGTREIRKHLLAYVKGIPGARQYRSKLVYVNDLNDIKHSLSTICNELECQLQV
ncbi:dihydrouridine synthase [Candidatus Marinamargulisbacteria bacterium SCGC AG-410-N11]|nr:dihydrouridine synthase [Candidatus Marinamargulisbacteria bacterium SCGC AG-410-N11]